MSLAARRFGIARGAAIIAIVALIGGLRSGSAQTTITYVQGNSAVPQTSQSTVTVAFTAAQTAGNLNVVVVGWRTTTTHILSVSDTAGRPQSRAAAAGESGSG